jgi:putative inorganic carbon (hco3(-)) transporter
MPDIREELDRIVLLNFGGIGDEILFSPVIQAIREACPEAHITLILEARSGRIKELLPQLDSTVEVILQKHGRAGLFFRLLRALRGRHYDAVISSGSSPFISLLLGLSGIPIRIGFDSGRLSQKLLTAVAPLDRKAYAGEMYYSLAKTFLQVIEADDVEIRPAVPQLMVEDSAREKALQLLEEVEEKTPKQRIFIHPGVSRVSVVKNILKAWPLDHWQALLEELPVRYPKAHIFLVGGPDDGEAIAAMDEICQAFPKPVRSRIHNLYGKTATLRDLAGLTAVADLLISVDSAPMHLAVGLGTPVVAIFAPTDEKKLLPPEGNKIGIAARNDLLCRPCLWDDRKTSCDQPVCLDVPVSAVLEKIDALLPATNGIKKRKTKSKAEDEA